MTFIYDEEELEELMCVVVGIVGIVGIVGVVETDVLVATFSKDTIKTNCENGLSKTRQDKTRRDERVGVS